jgi:hypothetical protein
MLPTLLVARLRGAWPCRGAQCDETDTIERCAALRSHRINLASDGSGTILASPFECEALTQST